MTAVPAAVRLAMRKHQNGMLDVRTLGQLGEAPYGQIHAYRKGGLIGKARADRPNAAIPTNSSAHPPVWWLEQSGPRWAVVHKSGRVTPPPPTVPDKRSRQWCLTIVRRLQQSR